MFCEISSSQVWHAHLLKRLAEASAINLLDPKALPSRRGWKVFVPAQFECASIEAIDPRTSLRTLLPSSSAEESGWVAREDLFIESATWLSTTFGADNGAWLVCEAGYCNVGDKILQQRPHVVHGSRPLLRIKIADESVENIATVLRWGRSWRFLGVVQPRTTAEEPFRPSTQGLFICDAFDGDSLIFANLAG